MDRVIWVTGGARGIGLGIAEVFYERGDRVVIADIDQTSAIDAAAGLGNTSHALGLACDVTDPKQVDACLQNIRDHFGRLDVLVNNAGICPFIDVIDITPEVWRKTLSINLDGAFYCSHVAAQQMIDQGDGGRMIFITSLSENVTGPQQVDYGASKAGMRMLMVGMATALGKHNITCNAIAPGMIATEMSQGYYDIPENRRRMEERIPLGRLGTPRDIGRAAAFLASEDAAYISGMSIRVDGGHQTMCV